MSHLPRITSISITGYEMYPGTNEAPGLHRELQPGATLIVGANGLGKTTLITLLRDMCAGPHRIRNRGGDTFAAGGLDVAPADSDTFANRVPDRAKDAMARLTMTIGPTTVNVERTLRNLSLTNLTVDGNDVPAAEDTFQELVVQAAGVQDFADWLLLLDHLVFVTEDRRLPFWDRNVQRQLLRVLTNDPDASRALAEAEDSHISIDSRFRNTRNLLNRQRQRFEAEKARVAGSGNIRDEIAKHSKERDDLDAQIAGLEGQFEDEENLQRRAAQETEAAEQQHQIALDRLEVARYAAIEAAYPSPDEVARYLRARLATDDTCVACGQAPDEGDAAGTHCVVCGRPTPADAPLAPAAEDLAAAEDAVDRAATAADANRDRLEERTAVAHQTASLLAAARGRHRDLEAQIRALRAKLPAGSEDPSGQESLIAAFDEEVKALQAELDASRAALEALIVGQNESVQDRQDEIKAVFDRVATLFLVERCHLVPHQIQAKIGQEGSAFLIQAFDLDLSSATGPGESRRNTSTDVSESQRVFIDIAFRIALIHTCAPDGMGTIVIDAPESSLDAVFADNAAKLLGAFVEPPHDQNRLVVATNLIDGMLLPALVEVAGVHGPADERLINLLQIAAPTAAVRERSEDYDEVLTRALAGTPS